MNFDFSDEQKELKEHARRFLKDQCDLTVPRAILESDEPYAKELWKGVAEMGFTGAAIPEDFGGTGFGYLELCCIAEELGRAVAPIPFSSSIYLASEAIIMAGSGDQKSTYLPKLAAGEIIGTLASAEGIGSTAASEPQTTFSNGTVSGTKVPVPDGDIADFAIVSAKDGNGITLAVVDLNGDGVTRSSVETVDPTRSHGTITFNNAPAEPLGDTGAGAGILQKVIDRAAVLFAFEQVGGTEACLHMARTYSMERYAFGRQIGSFQALKHRMADMYVKMELARSNCYYAAWALSSNAPELGVAAAGCRIAATDAYEYASKENIQIHGGMGFTWEYDAHFFYRRAKLLALTLGGSYEWKERLITNIEATV